MITAIRQGWIITERDVLHWVRQPAGPLFGIAFSVMLLLMFGFLFGGAMEVPGGGDYFGFLLPGLLAVTMLFGVESTTIAVAKDARRGVTDRFRSMPIAGSAVVLGRTGADMLNSAVSLGALIGVGWVTGWRIDGGPGEVALAIALLLWLRFAFLWVGVFLGLAFPSEGTQSAVQVLVWPIGFLSSAFVAPETMPAWLGAVADWNPLSATAAAARQLFGNPTGVTEGFLETNAVVLAVALPLAITAIFLPLSIRAFRRLGR